MLRKKYKNDVSDENYAILADSITEFIKNPLTYDMVSKLNNSFNLSETKTFVIKNDTFKIAMIVFNSEIGKLECTSVFVQIFKNDKLFDVQILEKNIEDSRLDNFNFIEYEDTRKFIYSLSFKIGKIYGKAIYSYNYSLNNKKFVKAQDFSDFVISDDFHVSIHENILSISSYEDTYVVITLPQSNNNILKIDNKVFEYNNNKYVLKK